MKSSYNTRLQFDVNKNHIKITVTKPTITSSTFYNKTTLVSHEPLFYILYPS